MLPLGCHFRLTRFEHSDFAIGEIGEPHTTLRILCEESDHLHPRGERKFSKLSSRRIKSGDVGAEIVCQPQMPGLFVNNDSVRAEIRGGWMIERHLFSSWIDLAESVTHDVSKPDVVLRVHLDAPHK